MHKLLDRFRQESGIYSIGFNPSSVAGQLFPFLFVLIVGGALSAWVIMR